MTHIGVGKLTIIGSDNGLSPGRRQAIIWTNARILLIGPLGTNFNGIFIGMQTFSFRKMHLKISSAKWHSYCRGLNVLRSRLWMTGKVEVTWLAQHSFDVFPFYFTSTSTAIPMVWLVVGFEWILGNHSSKTFPSGFRQNYHRCEIWLGVWLASFVEIWWDVLNLHMKPLQRKVCMVSMSARLWPNFTNMAAKKIPRHIY